jgi:methionyl-tRNA synthetase
MGTDEGWYCPKCADFKADNEIDQGELCPIHHVRLTREREDNYFFALSSFQGPLEELYARHEDFVAPRTRYNEALSFIRSGLRDVPLSRHKLTWGVPVPWDSEHVFYVWFDALLNYYSALSYASSRSGSSPGGSSTGREVGNPEVGSSEVGSSAVGNPAVGNPAVGSSAVGSSEVESSEVGSSEVESSEVGSSAAHSGDSVQGQHLFDRFWPADVHLIAKDILRFHTVYWPALLMAAGIELPRRVFVHGYLLMDGEKMSKSLGNVLDPFTVIDRFGSDALRFYLLRDVSFGQDGSVSTASFEQRYESELANEYGNLASRTLAMVARYRDGLVDRGDPDAALLEDFDGLGERVAELLDRVELTNALDEIWQRVRRLNRYVEEQAPWRLAKDPAREADLDRVLRTLVEGLRVVSVLLSPYLPDSTAKLLAALGAPDLSLAGGSFGAGAIERVEALEPLFPKMATKE